VAGRALDATSACRRLRQGLDIALAVRQGRNLEDSDLAMRARRARRGDPCRPVRIHGRALRTTDLWRIIGPNPELLSMGGAERAFDLALRGNGCEPSPS